MVFYALPAAGIFDFFKQIADFIGSIITFITQMVEGVITLLMLLPKCVTLLTDSIGALPAILVAFATVTITVCVIFIILGREHGGNS